MTDGPVRGITRWLVIAGVALLAGAGLGFVARDLLGLEQPAVAVAWLLGVAASLAIDLHRDRRQA